MVWNAKDWTMFFMGNGHITSDWGLMGGYPSAAGYRFAAHKTGLKERIQNGDPLPLGGDTDPDEQRLESLLSSTAQVKRDKQAITTEEMFEDYDLYLNYLRGGPGFGDPIERAPENVEADLNGGYLLPRFAEQVYGAVIEQDNAGVWHVDAKATEERRAQIRKDRLAKAQPTREWMKQERERILNKEGADDTVKQMFASSFRLGPRFEQEFRDFWELPDDWQLSEDELERPTYGTNYAMDISELPDVRPVQLVEE
jgi:acetone carboxylase alpha subunit